MYGMNRAVREQQAEYHAQKPPLESGDRVDEFERIYTLHERVKAERIEGVVYVASPVFLGHSEPHAAIVTWAGVYWTNTPRIRVADNQSVRLDAKQGIYRSGLLSGVWFDSEAFWKEELGRMLDVQGEGVKSADYATFTRSLTT